MDALINQILDLAGPMPDATAHRRYLKMLTPRQLEERLQTLRQGDRATGETVEFWGPRKRRELTTTAKF